MPDEVHTAVLRCPNGCFTVMYRTSGDVDLSHAVAGDIPDDAAESQDPQTWLNHLGAPTQVVRSGGCPSCGETPTLERGLGNEAITNGVDP